MIALKTTIICLLIGYPAAYFISRSSEKMQELVDELIKENPDCRIGVLSNGAETFLYE